MKGNGLLQALSTFFSRAPVPELGDPAVPVPPGILKQLKTELPKLPTPQPYQTSIRTALTQALQEWQANPEIENNNLVILGRPIEAITPIVKASLQGEDSDLPACDIRFVLGGYQRPTSALEIPSHLRQAIEPKAKEEPADAVATPVTQSDIDEQIPTVMVVPSLEQCFLRCIQGWEGIEYLQTMTTQDTSRFWVFGCNHWAWAFLDRVCKISAYLEQSITLPKLSDQDLQAWLAPMFETNFDCNSDGPTLQIDPTDTQWANLASLADGTASTAAQLWLNSLKVKANAVTEEGAIAADIDQLTLLPSKPALPNLISLETMDRYLLHSLLIHREMTRSQLALSLGEAERIIRSRLQVLRREGIILQRGRRFSVHPAHYPKLYSELSNNNFLAGEA